MSTEVKKVSSKTITQFKTDEKPKITQEKKILKQNSIGRIIPDDALRNINLSTVPSVIEDAIKQMALSVESKVLANALLLQIQRDIENLGDAIVEKNYIDEQVTYLTNIVNQKSNKGDVASIVDSKLAMVTPTLATANQVKHLSSRLDESQSSINEVKETINNQNTALATMVDEAEARIDNSLSSYASAVELTVKDGKIVSQAIENLKIQNAQTLITIEENKQAVVDEFGIWSAQVSTYITDSNGDITGFKFANGTGIKSSFSINANNFKISSSNNNYVPFRIENNNLFFNGKVTFSNVTGGDSIITKENIQDALNNNVVNIDGSKITTGYIGVGRLMAFSVTADKLSPSTGKSTVWSGGGLVSENFNGNHHGNIGSPTQGFRLSSNATGTSTDPNIYGAYIKASFIESLYVAVPGTNNYGNFNYTSYGSTVGVVGVNYGSGYRNNRVISLSNSVVVVKGFLNINTDEVSKWDISGTLQRSINSQAYTTIQTKRMYFNLPAQTQTDSAHYVIDISVNVTVWVDGKSGSGSGSGRDSGFISITISIAPKMAMITTLEFYYIENLQSIGNFETINYKIPGGTVFLTLNN
ncbi:hypothetical protein L5F37_03750 [Aliarcobacter butzleri]|uniref:hypothetical protein n=1 Tax=Aliarcobacter butzleri TaxID=28197 RepID=UPI001EDAEEB7|nr:hypothetical protein [Aliarcobacter butzleri]MCG3662508.1 hypothetical protein [Aliarcobacter butzleri]